MRSSDLVNPDRPLDLLGIDDGGLSPEEFRGAQSHRNKDALIGYLQLRLEEWSESEIHEILREAAKDSSHELNRRAAAENKSDEAKLREGRRRQEAARLLGG